MLTPIVVPLLHQLLRDHPNKNTVAFVLNGFAFGFDIGFRGLTIPSRPKNLRSALDNPDLVTSAIAREIRRGHTAGPFSVEPFPVLHCSPLGSAPKKDGTVRLVLDLSSPRGCSINEDIPKEDFAVSYSSFDDAVRRVFQLGPTAHMAKIDIQHAFRLCPVRLDQLHLLGFRWLSKFFIDLRLPFGSRSSPFIFTQFADVLSWIFITLGGIVGLLHYLDDFFLAAVSHDICAGYMSTMLAICKSLGVPVAREKTVGPAQTITYLGIEIDAAHQIVRLPPDKLKDAANMVAAWSTKRKCTKRELLSLIGTLSFAAKVVQPGRLFLRRLIVLSTSVDKLFHFVDINAEARADLRWWHQFLREWNGVQFFCAAQISSQDLALASDASLLGIGAVCGAHWFSVPLPTNISAMHINILELFAIFVAVRTWGSNWCNKHVLFFSDSNCVVQVATSGSCKDPVMMRILRALFFFSARHHIRLSFQHIPGVDNLHADLLSRLQVRRFRELSPSADRYSSTIPQDVWEVFTQDDTGI